jgi:hypothetical protein
MSLKDSWVWQCTSIIPALRSLRQEDPDFKANLGYIMSSGLSYLKRPYVNLKKSEF